MNQTHTTMKTIMKFTALSAFLLILAGGLISCNSEEKNTYLLEGTSWKLVGVVDVETGDLKVLEPRYCDICFTLTFKTDGTFAGRGALNTLLGSFEIDYGTNSIQILIRIMSEGPSLPDERVYIELLHNVIYFSSQKNTLRLYPSNKRSYMLFKQIEP